MSRCALIAAALLGLLAPAVAGEPTIFLVRHAEKADASAGDAKDPELSEPGRSRAESLARTLQDAGITSIYVTELKRTQQTAEPLARSASIKPTVVPARETAALVARLKDNTGNALVVGHSNTVPDIIKTLGAPEAITLDETEYDNLWIWRGGAMPQLIRLHYR
jgi:broad specificity phosphatase PhoE